MSTIMTSSVARTPDRLVILKILMTMTTRMVNIVIIIIISTTIIVVVSVTAVVKLTNA